MMNTPSLFVAASVVASLGCHQTLVARVEQPNPLCHPNETLRDSLPAVIETGDMDLRVPVYSAGVGSRVVQSTRRIELRNIAAFSVVSRDRLRFRIQLEHKWKEWADPTRWDIYMIDDRGRRHDPDDVYLIRNKHLVSMWDQEARSAERDSYGNITSVNQDGYKDRRPLGSLSMFRGTASASFYQRDLFHSGVESLTLVLARRGRTMKFTWSFDDNRPELAGGAPCEDAAGDDALAAGR